MAIRRLAPPFGPAICTSTATGESRERMPPRSVLFCAVNGRGKARSWRRLVQARRRAGERCGEGAAAASGKPTSNHGCLVVPMRSLTCKVKRTTAVVPTASRKPARRNAGMAMRKRNRRPYAGCVTLGDDAFIGPNRRRNPREQIGAKNAVSSRIDAPPFIGFVARANPMATHSGAVEAGWRSSAGATHAGVRGRAELQLPATGSR